VGDSEWGSTVNLDHQVVGENGDVLHQLIEERAVLILGGVRSQLGDVDLVEELGELVEADPEVVAAELGRLRWRPLRGSRSRW
jgi:hypothetical protein